MMNAAPKVTSERPSLPTLWLDTFVLVKLTKIDQGEALQKIEIERLTRLKALIEELMANGKLICPEADQEEEFVAKRLDKEVHGDVLVLSLGIRLQHRQGIFDYQVQMGMKAHVLGSPTLNLPLDIYFHCDPVEELNEARKRPFVIGASLFKDAELLARKEVAKKNVQEAWENLRLEFVGNKRTYDQQLQEERHGYADAVLSQVQEFEKKIRSGNVDSWDVMGVEGFLSHKAYWNALGGKPEGWKGVYGFFCSDYFNNLPIVRIRCQLAADLLTGGQPISSGDAMDVELLSVAVPISQYVLTDRRMTERIRRLGIDKEWGTEVYSMSDIDVLFGKLEALR
jgi:hypothetical protein